MYEQPCFLDLPDRPEKPRAEGLTHVLDKGISLRALDALLEQAADYIDVLKLGWGIGYVDKDLRSRALLCRQSSVSLCLGGTLMEVAAQRGRVAELAEWAQRAGVEALEVSNGLSSMPVAVKQQLIRGLSRDFTIFAETGAKDGKVDVKPRDWVDEMEGDLAAGARYVIAEGRESGTVGLYRSDGSPRGELADAIAARIPLGQVIFETPVKAQQTWFIRRFGANVGLGNVGAEEALALETLRLGLRADTADLGRSRVSVRS
ncbi:phosphohydrolase [Nocardioides pocheonensis]|uniref:Phosphohydrolase n=1 Tax=Nocardioides pocheonensis TaxID=661485 RepID=A0A3N0GIB3_9ACTN|nr:phosphohydrolase [Nocardioides pocheonensis]